MKKIEYRYIDKSKWITDPIDEFLSEPDKVQYMDEETGMPCLIVRGPSGALCGYVGVPESHPLFGKDYDELYNYENEKGVSIDVHGGLTFADKCHPREGGLGICHAPDKGESDNVWWFGFDCAHCGDLVPAYDSIHRGGIYRTIAYVENQIKYLARQLNAVTTPPLGG